MSLNVHIAGAVLICLSAAAFAADPPTQEQTFTDIEPGADVINPDKLIPLLDRGDVRAMNNIGLLWARGIGVPAPDYKEALRWWKEAARRGYVVSMNNLGLLYANGQGVEQDYAVAMNWWKMAAERGNAWAMNSVGDLYEHGLGVQQSYAEAFAWYERAAAAGDGLAMYNLGALYESGHGIEQNYKTAYDWYNRSADKGIGSAMYNLGRMLQAGRGLPPDKAEAYAWLTLAARYFGTEDRSEAKANEDALQALAPGLTSLERARGEELIHNLTERIEARRKAAPIKAGPGESET
jgi:TPR repeat protein